tara:strand:- start:853 stop:1287 length:435 start_codon:yes stop_codon:yes gene_type:complete
MRHWVYKGKEIKDRSYLPDQAVGIVYKIHNFKESKFYIGKKILVNKRTKPPLKGYKRKRVTYVESNWKTYTGSNVYTKDWNTEDCYREIVHICYNKTMMTYYETALQFQEKVLEDDKYLNDNILGKFFKLKIQQYKEESITKSK